MQDLIDAGLRRVSPLFAGVLLLSWLFRQRCNIGRKIGGLGPRESHVGHFWMRVKQEKSEPTDVEIGSARDGFKRWCLAGGLPLVAGNHMTTRAPAAREHCAVLGIGGKHRR